MRALVTGGAGFIGSSIARGLLARGDGVVVLDDFSTGRESNLEGLDGSLRVERGDVRDVALVEKLVRDVDVIFHEAAMPSVAASVEDPMACDAINVHGTVGLLEAARANGVERVIFAASAAAYGDDPELPKRETMRPAPLSPYAVSKVAGEHYLRIYAELYGMKTMSLRYFNVFGPRQDPASDYAAAIPKFISMLIAGERPRIFGDGEQTRDFCFIDNVVHANLLALQCDDARGQVVNVADGGSITINQLVAELAKICESDAEPLHVEERPGDIKHSRADISVAKSLLGYAPQKSVAEGLALTVEHFRGLAAGVSG
jgi:UDP-glucose 4-epimerase